MSVTGVSGSTGFSRVGGVTGRSSKILVSLSERPSSLSAGISVGISTLSRTGIRISSNAVEIILHQCV